VIDLHCHVLPGIDDGCATMADSVALAAAAAAGGTRTIVATPHVSWDHPANDAASIAEDVARCNDALRAAGVAVQILTGAEVAMTRAVDLPDEELWALHLAGGPWLLLECPLHPAAAGFERVARELQARGHGILLAHPERSPAFQRDDALLEGLVRDGMLASVTASSLHGVFGRSVEATARRWLDRGLVADASTDAHGPNGARDPSPARRARRAPGPRRAGRDPQRRARALAAARPRGGTQGPARAVPARLRPTPAS
jgi:protein-tyrosine phosphatase